MKLSKLFGKFFIALVVPSLMLSSCALIGLEEEDDDTTETASSSTTTTPTDDTTPTDNTTPTDTATPKVDTSGADTMTFGSYSYPSFTYITSCSIGVYNNYVQTTIFKEGTNLKKVTTYSSDANCSISAGYNPEITTYSNAVINVGAIGLINGSADPSSFYVKDPDNNSLSDGSSYIVAGLNPNINAAEMLLIVKPQSASQVLITIPDENTRNCDINSYSFLTDTTQCRYIRYGYTLSPFTISAQ